MPTALCPQYRQHGTGDIEGAENVGGELAFDGLGFDFLEGPELAITGVVDQHIEAPELFKAGADDAVGLRRVADVQLRRKDLFTVADVSRIQAPEVEVGGDHPISRRQRGQGDTGTNPAGATGD